jgi:general stress protein YciG
MASTDGAAMTPGGDFYWLTKTFTWSAHGSPRSSDGDDHGHNIIAADFGYTQDATLSTAPGGTYSAAFLGCNSCHDPHGVKNGGTKGGYGAITDSGSYGVADGAGVVTGNYRILGDIGYDGGQGAGANFANDVPVATTGKYIRESDADNYATGDTDGTNDLDINGDIMITDPLDPLYVAGVTDEQGMTQLNNGAAHTDYGVGMSEWCANCHIGFTADSSNPMRHPASDDAHLGTTYSINYNSYVASGDFTGTVADSYLALVPFERGLTDVTALDPTTTVGANASSNVACITCHRSHASAFQNMTRWDMTDEFIADAHPLATDGGVVGNDVYNANYGYDYVAKFGASQRSLCNKCHVQD